MAYRKRAIIFGGVLLLLGCENDTLRHELQQSQEALKQQRAVVLKQSETIRRLQKESEQKSEFITNYVQLVSEFTNAFQSLSQPEQEIEFQLERTGTHDRRRVRQSLENVAQNIEQLRMKVEQLEADNQTLSNISKETDMLRRIITDLREMSAQKTRKIEKLMAELEEKDRINALRAEENQQQQELIRRISRDVERLTLEKKDREKCYVLAAPKKRLKQLRRDGWIVGGKVPWSIARPTVAAIESPAYAGFKECDCSSQNIHLSGSSYGIRRNDIRSGHRDFYSEIQSQGYGLWVSRPDRFWGTSRFLIVRTDD